MSQTSSRSSSPAVSLINEVDSSSSDDVGIPAARLTHLAPRDRPGPHGDTLGSSAGSTLSTSPASGVPHPLRSPVVHFESGTTATLATPKASDAALSSLPGSPSSAASSTSFVGHETGHHVSGSSALGVLAMIEPDAEILIQPTEPAAANTANPVDETGHHTTQTHGGGYEHHHFPAGFHPALVVNDPVHPVPLLEEEMFSIDGATPTASALAARAQRMRDAILFSDPDMSCGAIGRIAESASAFAARTEASAGATLADDQAGASSGQANPGDEPTVYNPVLLTRTYDESAADAPEGMAPCAFSRVIIVHPKSEQNAQDGDVCAKLRRALALRAKYVFSRPKAWGTACASPTMPYDPWAGASPGPYQEDYKLIRVDGVFFVLDAQGKRMGEHAIPDKKEFFDDLSWLSATVMEGPVRSFAWRRLKLLEARFELHKILNQNVELNESKKTSHRDFYNVRKVDTHIHHASSMNHKHLLRFIKSKLKNEADTVVALDGDGNGMTLADVFDKVGLTAYDLSVDHLDVHAGQSHNLFHRFDRFNAKYSPIGLNELRVIFLKTSNHIKGRFLAELTHELFSDFQHAKYQYAEYRVSIYGKDPSEWSKLAAWFVQHKIASPHVRWLIQIPRLYSVYKASGLVTSFGEMLDNIFRPLFEVSLDPSSNPDLHNVLQQIVGFDSVDDESAPEVAIRSSGFPDANAWTNDANPPFAMYLYYLYANIASLNELRAARGLNTFQFRPHVGEAGSPDHLDAAFLLADGINHGINLRKTPALQYLYYLEQIPIAMSPLSNNALFLSYNKSPFPIYFARGLSVSVSTDDPLQFHVTREPLLEEFAIASHAFKLSSVDLSELARASVLQSGFEDPVKRYWLGPNYEAPGAAGNDISLSNVPDSRLTYRFEVLSGEKHLVFTGA